ncbi:hypothetical protein Nepgr_024600 [Nepenthes gracilis]|uniref:GIL1/IRKI C-terminal domain-containing protein n=1 Tax=Nepenthes gracilis TaxID=150966 RepID=A0AAD3T679_NEPGR|nr:hypothetical protein Nepgr_024600 [Nepenthes gracilis]
MAPPSSSSLVSDSKASSSPSVPHYRTHRFTPIQEGNESEVNEERNCSSSASECAAGSVVHYPTPLHPSPKPPGKRSGKKTSEKDVSEDPSVSCNNCRPGSREKTSVVPVDNVNKLLSKASPNGILKAIIHGLSRISPKPPSESSSSSAREEQWKLAVAELSHMLVQASRKRDEALLEASRLKYSMADLEKKLSRLEVYCHNLKSGLDVCSNQSSPQTIGKFLHFPHFRTDEHDKIIENFLISVSNARSSVRVLSRALTVQLRQTGIKSFERISTLLQPYDVKLSFSKNPRSLLFYLEALLNLSFFEDFESTNYTKNSTHQILNPIDKCESNYASFGLLRNLTWDEVLNKGTKHFSEEFSRFCDRKMSEIVALLGWNRTWPEPLLQAFFCSSKNVWLVHLLANSVHPSLPIFRVEKGAKFEAVYMEDMGGDRAQKLVPAAVRIMVSPGFYVYDNVVKCKVLCRYSNGCGGNLTANVINGDHEKELHGSYDIEN